MSGMLCGSEKPPDLARLKRQRPGGGSFLGEGVTGESRGHEPKWLRAGDDDFAPSSKVVIMGPGFRRDDSETKDKSGQIERRQLGAGPGSGRIIHVVFGRARRRLPAQLLLPFELHIGVDLVVAEDVALGQEGAVVVEGDQGLAQASRRRWGRRPAPAAADRRDSCRSGRPDGCGSGCRRGRPSAAPNKRDRDWRARPGSGTRRASPSRRSHRGCGRRRSGCGSNKRAAPAPRSRGRGACSCWSSDW